MKFNVIECGLFFMTILKPSYNMLYFYNKSLFICSFMIIFQKIVIENEISMTVPRKPS